ncbi:MAG: hypothetical protein V3T88_03595 [Nitrosomonadaceae bacterium]
MKQFMVTISDEEEKALLTIMVDIKEWIQNAISNRARQAIDTIVQGQTDKQPKKMFKGDKEQIINSLVLKTAKEKNKEFETKLRSL